MRLPGAAWLALSLMLAGGGCFGRCVDAQVAPPGVFCDTLGDCRPGECQFARCVDGQCEIDFRMEGSPCATAPNRVCDADHKCVKCRLDGVKNDAEGGVDCGVHCGILCADNTGCTENMDCASHVCHDDKKLCAPASCFDKVKNAPETDIDCGGTCPVKCADAKTCAVDADCEHEHCVKGTCCAVRCDGVCQTCASGACALVPDGGSPGAACAGPTDECDGAGHCKSCTNGHTDPGETDVDCGGPICAPCAYYDGGTPQHCEGGTDCATCTCTDAGVCGKPACTDGEKNGCETDRDCGGPWCGPTCAYGEHCNVKGDCLSKTCVNGKCGAP